MCDEGYVAMNKFSTANGLMLNLSSRVYFLSSEGISLFCRDLQRYFFKCYIDLQWSPG